MPSPVTTARQCLTREAAQSLDEAVSVARRRGHAQTTSLHAVSALLSLPSSALREACSRSRNNAYPSRIQFKALELSLGVSLDRLPSSPQRVDEPPISNSFMAAIKRSQANQRRQPENFLLYQQQFSSSSSLSTVKVELRNLILSILDDPVVSRVFGEAGFRSCDIKLNILRPVHQLLRYSRYKEAPLFLCNLSSSELDIGRRGFSFPFLGVSGGFNGEENCRSIGEVLMKKTGRNPVLVGVWALDVLRNFSVTLKTIGGGDGGGGRGFLPVELSGLSIVSIENEVLKLVTESYDEGSVNLRFQDVSCVLEQIPGGGVVINFGDLKTLFGDNVPVYAVNYLIRELAKVLECHSGKVWLIGAATRYETFFEFLKKFPSVEKDWDLQLLPITSHGPPIGTSCPRSSIMESFVPFGGFFSTPSEMKNPSKGLYQYVSRCHLCNEKCEQEVAALSKGGCSATSVADHYNSSLPSWLQMPDFKANGGLDAVKAKDDTIVPSAKVAALQKKWDNICQRLHYTQLLPKEGSYKVGSQVPAVVGFQVAEDRTKFFGDHTSNTDESSAESQYQNIKFCGSLETTPSAVISKSADANFLSKTCENPSKIEDELGGAQYPPCSLSSSSVGNGQTSPTSATSVTTDLGLGMHTPKSLSCTSPKFHPQIDHKDFKVLYTSLVNRIGWQEEAVNSISQTIVHCRTRNEKRHMASRGDIWFNFLGPDSLAKKKIAVVLAEILYGSKESFIPIDLDFHINGYDIKFRGKSIVDYIAEELSKKPLSVVYIENIDKADLPTQNSLSQAVRTGRFTDSHGREISICNAIFVTTLRFSEVNAVLSPEKKIANYLEENVLRAKCCPIQMLIGFDLGDNVTIQNMSLLDVTNKNGSGPILMNKRKLVGMTETVVHVDSLEMAKRAHRASNIYMDLNIPAQESETREADCEIDESDTISENSKAWLEGFVEQMDETVTFKPFDYDSLAKKIVMMMSGCFRKIVGSEGLLEIDSKVMEQMLAAVYLWETDRVDDWIEHVLGKAFIEAQKRYNLSSRSVVKLITCEALSLEDQAPDVFLPNRIIMN